MSFSSAFDLLAELGQNEDGDIPFTDNISAIDIADMAAYLGIVLHSISRSEQISLLRNELNTQNKFLTKNIHTEEVTVSEMYLKSRFIQEIVINNRRRSKETAARHSS